MFRLPFGRRGETGGDPTDSDEWALPDMECVEYTEVRPDHRDAAFDYEDPAVQPAGVFTAELVGWSPMDQRRAQWRFRVVPDSDVQGWSPATLSFVTSTVCRPDNHLFHLMAALGMVEGLHRPEDLQSPAVREQLRERCRELSAAELLGRRCRVEIEHVRDELGDVEPRIRRIAPLGWI